jgi:long-subunit acyl-CoA synthetase (AMP-forming)
MVRRFFTLDASSHETGLTETSPIALVMTTSEAQGRQGTCGRLVPTFEARLVDSEGQDVGTGESGELWLRGPSVMKGYLRNKKATDGTFSDGWLRTGDVAIVDDQGYFRYA